jgi:hypothetical protein
MQRDFCVLLFVIFLFFFIGNVALPDDSPPTASKVKTKDFIEKVTVVGELGQPLGKLVTIRGRWEKRDAPKDFKECYFVISQVNGNRLTKPIEWKSWQIGPVRFLGKEKSYSEGDQWELRGYESGLFSGIVDEAYQELWEEREKKNPEKQKGPYSDDMDMPFPQGGESFHFTSQFFYIKVAKIGSAAAKQIITKKQAIKIIDKKIHEAKKDLKPGDYEINAAQIGNRWFVTVWSLPATPGGHTIYILSPTGEILEVHGGA